MSLASTTIKEYDVTSIFVSRVANLAGCDRKRERDTKNITDREREEISRPRKIKRSLTMFDCQFHWGGMAANIAREGVLSEKKRVCMANFSGNFQGGLSFVMQEIQSDVGDPSQQVTSAQICFTKLPRRTSIFVFNEPLVPACFTTQN